MASKGSHVREKNFEDSVIASLKNMERSVKKPEPGNLEKQFQRYFSDQGFSRVTSERWRKSIVTVVFEKNVTHCSTTGSSHIDPDNLLSVREKERRGLLRRAFEKNFEYDLEEIHRKPEIPNAYKVLWDSHSAKVSKYLKERQAILDGMRSKQTSTDTPTKPQPHEESPPEPQQATPTVLNESATQTADDLSSKPSVSSRDSSSQTAAEKVDSSETLELSSEQPAVAPETIPPAEKQESSKPSPPSTRSTRKKAVKKDSKTDQTLGQGPIPIGEGGSSKTSPSGTRKSSDPDDPKKDVETKKGAFKDPPSSNLRRRPGSQSDED